MSSLKDEKNNIHFIIGMDRSGTTILTKLLNNFVDLKCLPEVNFLVFFLHSLKKHTITQADINSVLEQMRIYYLSHPWVGYEFDFENCKKSIQNELSLRNTLNYQNLCLLICENFKLNELNKKYAKLLIDKNTSNTLYVSKINSSFPNSKFIWIIRDYRANILSRVQHPELKSSNVAFNAIRWVLYNRIALKFYNQNKEKVLLIKYEELVLNNEEVMENICNFLNINNDMESKSLESLKIDISNFKVPTEHVKRFEKKYSDLNKPLNSDRIYSWQKELPLSDIQICDAICSSFAKEMGYKPFSRLNFMTIFLVKTKNIISIMKGYIDIYKDKLIYFFPTSIKMDRLKKRYTQLGFIKRTYFQN